MDNLIINRCRYNIDENNQPSIYIVKGKTLFSKYSKYFKKKIDSDIVNQYPSFFPDEGRIQISFYKPEDEYIAIDSYDYNYFEPMFVRELLIKELSNNQTVLVEPFPFINDLCIYEFINQYDDNWNVYQKYSILINKTKKDGVNQREIIFNTDQNNVLISKDDVNIETKCKVIQPDSGFIENNYNELKSAKVLANNDIRAKCNINNERKNLNYKQKYLLLKDFYSKHLLPIRNPNFSIEAGGLINVEHRHKQKVDINQNRMIFKDNKTNINAVSGMRDFGPYRVPKNISDNKFIFIYENRDDANKLYLYLKNGLQHFPGLWSYVGVPPTLDPSLSLNYSSVNNFSNEFDNYLVNTLTENNYKNYFAIVIGPFDRHESTKLESELYYKVKEQLLQKNITSQFINYKNLRNGSFHYFLPNIAIAILAKAGGIPWRLESKPYNELVIGFNQKIINGDKYIGSAVFFSNEGEIGGIRSYPESDSQRVLIQHLRDSIRKYLERKKEEPKKVIIHYYKKPNRSEKESIEKIIYDEFELNIPFAIIEINDSKDQLQICFDPEYKMGMPESGTFVQTARNEYLLFNNTRYKKFPLNPIKEVLPIKIKISFADTGGFSHKKLISQIYEFSRLYWRGLAQKSQPVTTLYAKRIANYYANFKNGLPNNDITQNSPWFL